MPSRAMRPARALAIAVAALMGAALAPVPLLSLAALADCATIGVTPPSLAEASGTTFIGEPVARRTAVEGETTFEWRIQRVYNGTVERGTATLGVNGCTGAYPTLGRRYLITTARPEVMGSENTYLWRIRPDGTLKLQRTAAVVDGPPAEVRALRTLDQALDAIVPGWSGRIPAAPRHPIPTVPGRWLPMAEAPFGAQSAAWAWTGTELVVAGREAIAWDAATDAWRPLPAPPRPVSGGAHGVFTWTGTELLTWESAGAPGTDSPPGLALDPATGTWRELPPLPTAGNVVAATWTGDRVVVLTDIRGAAAYDPAADSWSVLRPVFAFRDPGDDTEAWSRGRLVTAGGEVFAVDWETPDTSGARIWQLEPDTGGWWQPGEATGYATRGATPLADGQLLFAGRDLVFPGSDDPAMVIDVFDPTDRSTLTRVTDCLTASDEGAWTGRLLVAGTQALDPETGRCLRLPEPANDRTRYDPIEVWTGTELIRWSGGGGEGLPALPDGLRFVPDRPSDMGLPTG